ncbi:MAG: site-2 protease family protein [bacterium]|nr:site-2 protease family protein [bacterium]
MQIDFLFAIAVLIMSVVLHEVSHGYVAYILGDPTAKYAGRLTLNPLKHLDLFGSVIIPIFTYLAGGFILGWAKPVPFNPYNLKNKKWGPAIVGIAGPATNFLVLLVFGLALRFNGYISFLPASFFQIAATVALINATLMILNLIPIPPLDGSRVLQALLPYRWQNIQYVLERYSFFFVLIFIFFIWPYLFLPIVGNLFKLITGLAF